MANNKYAVAYSEVLEILKHIPTEDYNKIPRSKIELFETNADNEYTFNYNPRKTLEEQDVSNITKGIIILLFRDYWATELQRNKIIAKQNYDRIKLEEKKKEKYNTNNIFINNHKNSLVDIPENRKEHSLVEIDDTKWYKKFGGKLRNYLENNWVLFDFFIKSVYNKYRKWQIHKRGFAEID